MTSRTRPAPLLVGIAGGSGSGKSSLAEALVRTLGTTQVTRLSHDAYYRDRSALPAAARGAINYDVPDALDQSRFQADLDALRAGRPIQPPVYCFRTHCRTGQAEPVVPRPIVLIDGILLLWEPAVRAALDLSIYLDAPEDLRQTRRIARDVAERGRTTEAARWQFQTTVRDAHRAFVEPTRAMADLVLANVAPIERVMEIAAAVILDRLARRGRDQSRVA